MDKFLSLPKLDEVVDRIFEGIHTSADAVYVCRLIEDGAKLVKVHSFSKNKEYLVEKELLK